MASTTIRQSRVTAIFLIALALAMLLGVGMCALGTFSGAPQVEMVPQAEPPG